MALNSVGGDTGMVVENNDDEETSSNPIQLNWLDVSLISKVAAQQIANIYKYHNSNRATISEPSSSPRSTLTDDLQLSDSDPETDAPNKFVSGLPDVNQVLLQELMHQANKGQTSGLRGKAIQRSKVSIEQKRLRERLRQREKMANETPEQREARLRRIRERNASMSAEKREQKLARARARRLEKLKKETPEQREARLRKRREREANKTPEEKKAYLEKRREAKNRKKLSARETEEHRAERLQRQREIDFRRRYPKVEELGVFGPTLRPRKATITYSSED